ncbi:oxidoreductase domain-containing protein [Melioribacter roseus P3M-2]|uniref:Oxidoreductase domain-containing protein n=1 Tax=Melioribacter roseus (strain DSM 23840 / JCM 17771 / VKM B-2668 / P3M-2) TaxID=1191523 RepID=I6Z900_MELRP|nr:Gfo/Idh/MocA family oxidoreductase [Melioribacter roseus]AFN75625.1 oxidoreductase domain-containing protein [Melioribacter roseus P3M-2]
MNKLKIGVIGTGHLGRIHVKLLKELDNVELCGVYDKDFEKSKNVSEEFGVKQYQDMDKLINDSEAVVIVATTSAHYELVKKAFGYGKHVFVEKPITAHISEAEELVAISEEKNLKLQVGHIERFNPALVSLEKYELNPMFIQSDRLAQFNPRGTDVAVILDLMIHDIDIILSLVKSEIKDIRASGISVVSNNIDIANARIEFENFAVANVTASRISQKRMRKMRMFQQDTYFSVDFIEGSSEIIRLMPQGVLPESGAFPIGQIGIEDKKRTVVIERPDSVNINPLQYELKLFAESVLNDTVPPVTGYDGLKALRVAEQIIRKIEESISRARFNNL